MKKKLLDKVYDSLVVPSYTRFGYELRTQDWEDLSKLELSKKTFMVTGATSGIGLSLAKSLANLNARVILIGRNAKKLEGIQKNIIEKSQNRKIMAEIADLSKIEDLQKFRYRIINYYPSLDCLICNAGTMVHEKQEAYDGIEYTFATNVLGHFFLLHILMPLLSQSKDARVIDVSSGGMYTQKINLKTLLKGSRNYDGVQAYAQTKRAQVILSELAAEKFSDANISFSCMHPGWADTPGVQTSLPRFHKLFENILRDPMQAADTALWLAVSEETKNLKGQFFFDRKERKKYIFPGTKENFEDREKLWQICYQAIEKYLNI